MKENWFYAAQLGDSDMVRQLVGACGRTVDGRKTNEARNTFQGLAAIHYAALNGDREMLSVLLGQEHDLSIPNAIVARGVGLDAGSTFLDILIKLNSLVCMQHIVVNKVLLQSHVDFLLKNSKLLQTVVGTNNKASSFFVQSGSLDFALREQATFDAIATSDNFHAIYHLAFIQRQLSRQEVLARYQSLRDEGKIDVARKCTDVKVVLKDLDSLAQKYFQRGLLQKTPNSE